MISHIRQGPDTPLRSQPPFVLQKPSRHDELSQLEVKEGDGRATEEGVFRGITDDDFDDRGETGGYGRNWVEASVSLGMWRKCGAMRHIGA